MDSLGIYAKENPDAVARIGAALLPAFGLGALSPAVNVAAGAYGVTQAGARDQAWAEKKPAADPATKDFEKDPTKPVPTAEQRRLAAGGGMPPTQGAIAAQTIADTGTMTRDIAQRRADALKSSQRPLGGGMTSAGPLPFAPRPIFAQTGSQGPSRASVAGTAGSPGNVDLLAKLLTLIKSQG